MHCDHVDISQAFCQGDLLPDDGYNGKVFISPTPGYDEDPDYVYHLRKQLYGMPSAAHTWHHTMSAYLKSQACTTVGFERSMWTVVKNGYHILIAEHIDDTIISCEDCPTLDSFRKDLAGPEGLFDGTYEGEIRTYLGCDIVRNRMAGTTMLSQKHYAEEVLCTFDYWDCIPALTPMKPGARHTQEQSNPHRSYISLALLGYCQKFGIFGEYDSTLSCLSYSELSKYIQCTGQDHMDHVLWYLKATYDQAIVYQRSCTLTNTLWDWVDSDWAANADTCCSHTGYVLTCAGVLSPGSHAGKTVRLYLPLKQNTWPPVNVTKKSCTCVTLCAISVSMLLPLLRFMKTISNVLPCLKNLSVISFLDTLTFVVTSCVTSSWQVLSSLLLCARISWLLMLSPRVSPLLLLSNTVML
jgi:hypothetical protein